MWTIEILQFLLLLLRTGCTAQPGTAGSQRSPAEEVHHTNVIFIMADDIGYGDVRYNGGNVDTPNLDAMAGGPHSMQLTRYYAGSPVCMHVHPQELPFSQEGTTTVTAWNVI